MVFDRKVDYGDKVGTVARVTLPNARDILCNSLFASLLVLGIQLGLQLCSQGCSVTLAVVGSIRKILFGNEVGFVNRGLLFRIILRGCVFRRAVGFLFTLHLVSFLHGSHLGSCNGLKLSLALTSSVLGYRFQHGWLYIALRRFGRSNGWHFGFRSIQTGSCLKCFGLGYRLILLYGFLEQRSIGGHRSFHLVLHHVVVFTVLALHGVNLVFRLCYPHSLSLGSCSILDGLLGLGVENGVNNRLFVVIRLDFSTYLFCNVFQLSDIFCI